VKPSIGCWVGIDAAGVVQSAHIVTDHAEDDDAILFVRFPGASIQWVDASVSVRLGEPLPSPTQETKK
jgi:hypothetical protein